MGRYIIIFYDYPAREWKVEPEGFQILNSIGINTDKVRYRGFGEWEIICSKNQLMVLLMMDGHLLADTTEDA